MFSECSKKSQAINTGAFRTHLNQDRQDSLRLEDAGVMAKSQRVKGESRHHLTLMDNCQTFLPHAVDLVFW